MKPQILILSILLAVSVIFNIVLLQAGDSDTKQTETNTGEIQTVTAEDINNLENITSTLYTDLNRSSDKNIDWVASSSRRFLMRLQYLREKAESEQATETVQAIDGMIMGTKNRLNRLAETTGVDISDTNRARRPTTYQQRQEREQRLQEQQGQQPLNSSPNDR